jgi:hypothetical protein
LKKENSNQDNKLNQKKMAILSANGKIRELKKEIKMLTKEGGNGKDKGKSKGMGKGKGKSKGSATKEKSTELEKEIESQSKEGGKHQDKGKIQGMGKGKDISQGSPTKQIPSNDLEKSRERKEKMYQEAKVLSSALADLYAPSPMVESLKMTIVERDENIKELNNELLQNRKAQHLGCDVEIQMLKSQIVDLQQKLQSTTVIEVVPILFAASEKQYLREQELENEVQKLRGQLADVRSKLKTEKEQLEKNQKANDEKYKKNA